jgi:hypothetical protein
MCLTHTRVADDFLFACMVEAKRCCTLPPLGRCKVMNFAHGACSGTFLNSKIRFLYRGTSLFVAPGNMARLTGRKKHLGCWFELMVD